MQVTLTITQYLRFALHWYMGIFLSSFYHNHNCCDTTTGKKQEGYILEKAIDFTNIPFSLENATDYVKELVQRTGKLLHNFLQRNCTEPRTTKKIYVEQIPELKYFIEASDEMQQVYGTGYQMFDMIF